MNVKKLFRAGMRYLTNSEYRFFMNCNFGMYNRLSDEEYLKRKFKVAMRKELDLENPETYNEKLQWLKLYDRKPEYTMMVDKYLVRNYIAETIGEEYLIPLLGVWDDPDEIDFDSLPDRFVLKCNHNSGLGMYICRDKSKMDIKAVKAALRKGLRQDYYLSGREWPYKDVPRKIVAEAFMSDAASAEEDSRGTGGLTDYKFFCFNGYVDCVMVCIDRHLNDTKFYFFDREWKLKRLNRRGLAAPPDFTLSKPTCLEEMFVIAEKLSAGLPFSRIDLYECGEKVYFGEITFFPDSGFDPNILSETDLYFGQLLSIENIKTTKQGEQ